MTNASLKECIKILTPQYSLWIRDQKIAAERSTQNVFIDASVIYILQVGTRFGPPNSEATIELIVASSIVLMET